VTSCEETVAVQLKICWFHTNLFSAKKLLVIPGGLVKRFVLEERKYLVSYDELFLSLRSNSIAVLLFMSDFY